MMASLREIAFIQGKLEVTKQANKNKQKGMTKVGPLA